MRRSLLFCSGATVPLEVMSEAARGIARFVPLTHAIGLMGGVWLGISWVGYPKEIAVLAAQCMVGVAVAVRIFRWE